MPTPKQREALSLVADGKFFPALVREDDGWHARWRAVGNVGESVGGWVDEYVRGANLTRLTEDAEEQRHETLHDAWMMALKSRTGLVAWDEAECAAFAAELDAWSGSADEDVEARRKIVFSLETGGADAASPGAECADAPPFAVSCAVPEGRRALKALGQAAYVWTPLAGLRAADAPAGAAAPPSRNPNGPSLLRVRLSLSEAEDFLHHGAGCLRDAGYGVAGVDLSAPIAATAEIADASGRRPPAVSLAVRVAGEPVTAAEIRFLLEQGSTLVFFRNRWIEVDRGILREALRALEKGVGKKANVIGFALGIGHVGGLDVETAEAHGWLRGLVNELRNAGRAGRSGSAKEFDLQPPIPGFVGELRDYQKIGVAWIRFLTSHGFGALLADDMGLGKTVQVIAWLCSQRQGQGSGSATDGFSSQSDKAGAKPVDAIVSIASKRRNPSLSNAFETNASTGHGGFATGSDYQTVRQPDNSTVRPPAASHQPPAASRQPVLIVAPLTLLSNWKHEFARFAPGLGVYVHQGEGRHVASGFRRAALGADVTLTSYNLLVRDYSEFSEVEWSAIVLDEAQAVKNPDTRVARAVRALMPPVRIALTGTPVENSVADVWALEDFLNPGFLGERKSFVERFVRPIAADAFCTAGRRLQRALEPFVLRRLKSDRRIAAELGGKREIREYCELSPAQRRDYEAALADFRAHDHAPGDVFALMTRLKLVCDGEGKLLRLAELLEAIFAAGESALVFTQYAKVGVWLRGELETRFGRRFPFLHGSLPAKAREEEIARFNRRGAGAFILSLKAGGFGLNLTKATHVIHFDRWWNPAVENQATDRAHRIGQTRDVFVHLFIGAGTLEEHVDELLARKARIAGSVITEAEWLEAVKLDG